MNNSEKILYLDAVHEIKNLKYRYFKACDNHNISQIEASFCDGDIHIDFENFGTFNSCLLYTSPSPRDKRQSRMPSSA